MHRAERRLQDVSIVGLLQMETAQQILKTRLRAELRPNRVDFEIDQNRFGPPIAILERI